MVQGLKNSDKQIYVNLKIKYFSFKKDWYLKIQIYVITYSTYMHILYILYMH